MTFSSIIITLLFLGAFFHLIQGFLYGFNKDTIPVFIWGLVLCVLAVFWMSTPVATWVKWATLIMPVIGGGMLGSQLKDSTNAKWIDYSIIILDIFTIGIMIYLLFIQ